jgi:hypothetical protein
MKSKIIKTICFASFAWTAGAILTPDAWGADTVVYAIQGGTQALGTLDLNTGVYTQISPHAIGDYELGVYGGVLYGADVQCGCLFQLNTSTGVPTSAPNYFQQNASGFGGLNGFGSTTDGLFAMAAAAPGGVNYLWSVNPATGVPTLIGSTGVVAGGGSAFLSASNDSSKLYWEVQNLPGLSQSNGYTDTLYSINTSTGAATLIGTWTFNGYSNTGNAFSMVFVGGTLWANFYGSGFGTINTSNGAQTLVSTGMSVALFGIAPFPLTPTATTLVGSMGHLAAEENWTTTFTLVNKGEAAAQATLNFFGDASDPTGNGPLALPLTFPQLGATNLYPASSYSQTIAANASLIVATTGPQTPPVLVGSAQLLAAGAVDGFAIFHLIPGAQEAVVPMETRNASSYILAFDNTGGVVLGIAIDNVSPLVGNVGVVIRDATGAQIGTGSLALAGNGHTSFVLSIQYPVTANIQGTVEFDTPAGGQISVLGIRTTPLGSTTTLTTIPPLANVGTNGGSIAHIATGNGWQTTFVLVNTGTASAQVGLNFYADVTGAPLSLPLTFPLGSGDTSTVASTVSQSLAPGATLLVQSAAPLSDPTPTIGSAQLTTNGNVGGFVIFRYNPNGQEAVVPLESRNATGYIIAFDNTSSTATGIAINNASAQAASVPVVVRNDAGVQIASDTLSLAANGHLAFTLVSDKYPATANVRGTIEFDNPSGAQIGALGIRIPVAHTFTTLPALVK